MKLFRKFLLVIAKGFLDERFCIYFFPILSPFDSINPIQETSWQLPVAFLSFSLALVFVMAKKSGTRYGKMVTYNCLTVTCFDLEALILGF